MSLQTGEMLGPYQITGVLGKGGMGQVYRAVDTRLKRDVAIKVAEAQFSDRFLREARAIASLNHPNICTLYDVGPNYLVMELVEGPTLAERIKEGAMPMEEALTVARQIGDALEAAHDKGITHRDLKPGNVKIRPDGMVKVLDFGLAKIAEPVPEPSANPDHSPTLTLESATRMGMILGTAGYMAPEQARGKGVDKRADIWAFGVVFYEMLSGKRLFQGRDVSELLAAVIRDSPDLNNVPARVRPMLARCLEKDPKDRLRDIGDAWLLMDQSQAQAVVSNRATYALAGLALTALAGAALVSFVHFREQAPTPAEVRFDLYPPVGETFTGQMSVSPDGRYLLYGSYGQGRQYRLWLRRLDTTEARPVPRGEDPLGIPFWSPDSSQFGFASQGRVKTASVNSGSAQSVYELGASNPFFRGTWNEDGVILAAYNTFTGIYQLAGGTSKRILDGYGPVFLPGGRKLLYQTVGVNPKVVLGSLDTPAASHRAVMASERSMFQYVAEDEAQGWIVQNRQGMLMAQRVLIHDGTLAGDAIPLTEGVTTWAASRDVLAYRQGTVASSSNQLIWWDRTGKKLGELGRPQNVANVFLSQDGKTALIDRNENGQHVWYGDTTRGAFARANPGETPEYAGVIAPSGRIAFTYVAERSAGDIYSTPAPGSGAPEAWVINGNMKHPNAFSADGKYLIYDEHNGPQLQDLWIVPTEAAAGGVRKPIPFLVTAADETFARFSPDGKWVVYSSNESGRRDVYVRPFTPDKNPAAGPGKWLVSTEGGDKPNWSRDGKFIFYLSLDNKMMEVPVKISGTFEAGNPRALFETRTNGFVPYDITGDGRFLVNTPPSNQVDAAPFTVVLNWRGKLGK